ncbi:hypothetical protein GOC91_10440 [Sinorhizobium medicae]|uniref:Uncharacterized protein n=3 Tax=Sinorhizobium medicae TaxID=110321 RepID=A0A6G1WNF1_9HYPH|nr:hypothetical protein [Sinorhizobium medicae]MDX0409830.1 hypothetical protein [Sinorhizobium medicae]MDX0416324.1 hypothetical protein [Sinorhizobium medicae]MDX0428769.1 hypothetical protein [Sinorhizobium medicae]MDX0433651.1 hypothetical protein [Sinorhizobium medicae]
MRFDRLDKVGTLLGSGRRHAPDMLVTVFPRVRNQSQKRRERHGETMGHAAKAEPAMLHAAGSLAPKRPHMPINGHRRFGRLTAVHATGSYLRSD